LQQHADHQLILDHEDALALGRFPLKRHGDPVLAAVLSALRLRRKMDAGTSAIRLAVSIADRGSAALSSLRKDLNAATRRLVPPVP
jgi:hypothetical protein